MSDTHTLVITSVPDPGDPEFGDIDYSIECPGVTDACRSWQPCPRPEADHDPARASGIHHGEMHIWHEGRFVGLDRCQLVSDSDTLPNAAEELAVKHKLGPGRYLVHHSYDDGDVDVLTLAEVSA